MWPKLKKKIWQWREVLISAPSVAGLVIAISYAGLFQLLEWNTLDQFFRLRPLEEKDPRIVIVTISESDITHVGQWPIPDHVLAELLKKIKGEQPRAIGLDIYRDLPVKPGHQALVKVFESTPNLFGVEKLVGDSVAPPPTLSKLGQVSMADLVLDADGKVRRALVSVKPEDGKTRFSLGTTLALTYLKTEGVIPEVINATKKHLRLGKALFVPLRSNDGGYVKADVGGYQILLNFRGSLEQFHTISLREVLENQVPPNLMRDRIVLIGSIGQSTNDYYHTPYSSSFFGSPRGMAGVVIHANLSSQMLSAALEGRPLIKVWTQPGEWLWIVLWSFIGTLGSWTLLRTSLFQDNFSLKWQVLILGILLAGGINICGSYLAFLGGWWLPVASPLVAMTAAAIVIMVYHSQNLFREKTDLEILLETTTQHSDAVEAELHQRAEEAARESQRRLIQFLEAVPVGVAVIDASAKPYFINQRAKQLLGKGTIPLLTSEQLPEIYQIYLAGTNQLYPSENLPIMRALAGETLSADDLEIHQGDKIIPIEAWGTPIYDEFGEIAYAIVAFQDITERNKAEAERKKFTCELFKLNLAYERFVPKKFLELLDKESITNVQLGEAVLKEMSILFSDIRSFTTISESMTLEDNFKFLNAYLSRMEPAIVENHGFIDKYIGDAIMALFSRSADDAVQAAIAMLHQLADYNATRQTPERPPIKIGIGINTGSLMLGTVGGHQRMDSTVISDAVNLAYRLEELTKVYGVSLLISHHTLGRLQNAGNYCIRFLDRVKVKGKSQAVGIFEVFDADLFPIKDSKLATKAIFEESLFLYHKHSFREAAQLLKDCLRLNPSDQVAQIYLERCQQQGSD